MKAPVASQQARAVACRFALDGSNEVRFNVGAYDKTQTLVIDPVVVNLAYSTLLGGAGEDRANAVAVDAVGNTFVAGTTSSAEFPATGIAPRANKDVFY